ncbi:hypothetical protein NMY22_g16534 [Coprinellus aureogranulatus]|nr:hypothetical protein NMY22_g16534 [Coprinellus aureogranulatus]
MSKHMEERDLVKDAPPLEGSRATFEGKPDFGGASDHSAEAYEVCYCAIGRIEHNIPLSSLFMFRLALRRAMSSKATAATKGPSSSTSASAMPKKNPKDWEIIGTSPGNVDMMFQNRVEGTYTWYTPEGMAAEEIMQIPTAKDFFVDVDAARWYIDYKAKEKAEILAKGFTDP